MNPESDDPQLRQLFTEQRRADVARAPAFASVCSQARSEAECRRAAKRHSADSVAHYKLGGWLRPAIALAIVALMAALFVVDRQPRAPSEQLVASVLDWQSPTDFLLDTSSVSLSVADSSLTSSIAEIVPQLPPTTNPTEKETP